MCQSGQKIDNDFKRHFFCSREKSIVLRRRGRNSYVGAHLKFITVQAITQSVYLRTNACQRHLTSDL